MLREKGLLSEMSKDVKPITEELVELTIEQQLKRAQAIEEINSSSFVQQDFKSTKIWGKVKHEPPSEVNSNGIESEISGIKSSVKLDDSWKNNIELLIHPKLSEDLDKRNEKWRERLIVLREKFLNS